MWGENKLRLYLEMKPSDRLAKRRRKLEPQIRAVTVEFFVCFFHKASVITEYRSSATCYFPPVFFLSVSFCHQLEDTFPFFKSLAAAPIWREWMMQLMFSHMLPLRRVARLAVFVVIVVFKGRATWFCSTHCKTEQFKELDRNGKDTDLQLELSLKDLKENLKCTIELG